MFFCEYYEIFKNINFEEHLRTAVSLSAELILRIKAHYKVFSLNSLKINKRLWTYRIFWKCKVEAFSWNFSEIWRVAIVKKNFLGCFWGRDIFQQQKWLFIKLSKLKFLLNNLKNLIIVFLSRSCFQYKQWIILSDKVFLYFQPVYYWNE